MIDRRFPGPRPSAVARTRILDDALVAALDGGIEQLVILGAGYDSRPYRLPGCARVRVFEVDHPDTQAVKCRVLGRVLGQLPAHLGFVGVGFDPDLPAYLRERGWTQLEDLSTTEALTRLGMDPSGVPAFYRIARARH